MGWGKGAQGCRFCGAARECFIWKMTFASIYKGRRETGMRCGIAAFQADSIVKAKEHSRSHEEDHMFGMGT